MKILTEKNFEREGNKMLSKKQRWNNTLDVELCKSVLLNVQCPVYTQGIPVHSQMVTINDTLCTLMVIYNPYMVISRGWSVAGCLTDTVSQIIVFVDDDYMQMSKDTQEFIMYHELGHIACNHNSVLGIRNINQEYEADMYASKYSTHGIAALTEISTYCHDKAKKELKLRINYLSKEAK